MSSANNATTALPGSRRPPIQSTYGGNPTIQTLSIPAPLPDGATVCIMTANVHSYMRNVYNGEQSYPYPTTFTLGSSAIGRVVAVGHDATLVLPGMLVLIDITIRSRDCPRDVFMSAIHKGYADGNKRGLGEAWRDGESVEYVSVPLENCRVLDKGRLLGRLGYELEDLMAISKLVVPYGGMVDVGLKPGETVIVAPATGGFGVAAVKVALAMGAGKVITMGRDEAKLARLVREGAGTVVSVRMTGDLDEEVKELTKYGPADVFFDISPPAAARSSHFRAGIMALTHSGRVSMMGGQNEHLQIPHVQMMHFNLMLKGTWMYEREGVSGLVQLIETGILKL